MSVAGLKKQFYKASQIMSEKVGGAEGTKLDEEFKDLERKTDITSKAVVEVLNKTSEYLQPNPATRAKLSMLSTVSKIRSQVKSPGYSQPEDLLGESMMKYGGDLGADTNFGPALVDFGESMKRLAQVKDSLDIDVKQNFIDPLQDFIDKDMRDIQHHLKKMGGRRLDYDYKKKRQGKIPDEEIRQALDKFDESKEMSQISMHNMLESDVEQVTQLASFATTLAQYHRQASEILNDLCDKLSERVSEANSRPRTKYQPKPRPASDYGYAEDSNGGHATSPPAYSHAAPAQYPAPSFQRASVKSRPSAPCCKAMYDFDPENAGELAFREGDIITLVGQIDENWLEGTVHGQTGYFPNNYVDIIVPLPH